MKRLVSWCAGFLAALTAIASPLATRAADIQPAVVVSVTNVDRVLSDIGYVTRAAGVPEVGGLATLLLGQFTQGLDSKRPSGVYVGFDGQQPVSVGFVPVANFDLVLGVLQDNLGEPEDVGGGILELGSDRPQPVFLKHAGDWGFFSNEKSALTNVPGDPAKMLGDLPKQYDIAVEIRVQNVPQELRDRAVVELKKGFEQRIDSIEDSDSSEFAKQTGENSLKSIIELIEGADVVRIGFNIDQESGNVYLDFSATAIEGSKLARRIVPNDNLGSKQAGYLLPDGAFNLHFLTKMSEADINDGLTSLKLFRSEAIKEIEKSDDLDSDEERAAARDVVNALFDVGEATVKEGLLNGGAIVTLGGGSLNAAIGGSVADGSKLDGAFQKLVELAKNDPEFPGVKLNALKIGDHTVHTMDVPIPESEEEARRAFGERVSVALAIGPKSIHLGLGKDGVNMLKRVIEASATETPNLPPVQLIVSIAPILEFASMMDNSNQSISAIAMVAKEVAAKDSVRLTGTIFERGVRYRLEVESGVLEIIGRAVQMSRQGNAGGDNGF